MPSGKTRSVIIYNPKDNTKICEIEAPQKWWSDIPIPAPFALISFHNAWVNQDTILRWAWLQAWIVASALNEVGIIKRGDILSPDFRCRCLVCGHDTFAPMAKHWFWSNKHKHTGFACSNSECSMYMTLLPANLLSHIEDIPKEYLPWEQGVIEPEKEQS